MTKTQVFLNVGTDPFRPFDVATAVLVKAAEFDLSPLITSAVTNGQPLRALELVFEELNIGDGSNYDWTAQYRANGNRSLSVGDVVVVGETAWAVGSFGWDRVYTDALIEAIKTPINH
jgi:hypothetical protein